MKKKTVAFVPIKLNSERLPRKNILPLGNRPLCAYIFESLLKVEEIDDVYVFCSDEKVMDYVPEGVKFLKREKRLDGNFVKGKEIYESFLSLVDSDIYLLAHTTSPFLTSATIAKGLNKVLSGEYDSALTVQRKQTFVWYEGKPLNYDVNDIPRTQDMEPVFIETSGFYIFKREHFLEGGRRIGHKPFLVEVDDVEAIDIDTKEDYEFALKIAGGHIGRTNEWEEEMGNGIAFRG